MILIDKLSYSSKLRYKSPFLKSFFSVSTLLICVLDRSVMVSIITLFVMGSLTVYKGGTSLIYYLKLYRIPLLFLLVSTFTIMINSSSIPLEFSIPVFNYYLGFTKSSVLFGIRLMFTALGAVSCLYFLSLTTPVTDLMYVLEVIHCPYLIIELLLLIYRFLFVLYDIAASMEISQKSRLGNKDFKTSLQGVSGLMVMLFIRALKKSSALYDAMEARCYDGKLVFLKESVKAAKKELLYAALFVICLGAAGIFIT